MYIYACVCMYIVCVYVCMHRSWDAAYLFNSVLCPLREVTDEYFMFVIMFVLTM